MQLCVDRYIRKSCRLNICFIISAFMMRHFRNGDLCFKKHVYKRWKLNECKWGGQKGLSNVHMFETCLMIFSQTIDKFWSMMTDMYVKSFSRMDPRDVEQLMLFVCHVTLSLKFGKECGKILDWSIYFWFKSVHDTSNCDVMCFETYGLLQMSFWFRIYTPIWARL